LAVANVCFGIHAKLHKGMTPKQMSLCSHHTAQ